MLTRSASNPGVANIKTGASLTGVFLWGNYDNVFYDEKFLEYFWRFESADGETGENGDSTTKPDNGDGSEENGEGSVDNTVDGEGNEEGVNGDDGATSVTAFGAALFAAIASLAF